MIRLVKMGIMSLLIYRNQAFPWGKVPPQGADEGRRKVGKLGFVKVSILRPQGALALPSREGGSRSETGELKT